jgi:hypothetical protein
MGLPFESMAMLCTHLNSPAMRPGRPKLASLSPVCRSSVLTAMLAPSATNM